MTAKREVFVVAGREVAITNPDKVFFPKSGYTKRDLALYYMAVADGAVRGVNGRPMALKRFPDGVEAEPFFQKRAPNHKPDWIETTTLSFPSGRTADEIVVRDAAQLAWIVNLGCVDLDPVPGVGWKQILDVSRVVKETLDDLDLVGWPKTSGSRGVHVYVRIHPKWGFDDVRRAALALAREIERRAPDIATSKWWKEERHGVFLDYNQNAKDRTVASAYSVRPTPDARVSMPLPWKRLFECDPADYTLKTVPEMFVKDGDAHAGIDDAKCSLEKLLALADAHERAGIPDAPWPPHYAKKANEPRRAPPSKIASASKLRREKHPLIIVARAEHKQDALDGLERWKKKHEAAAKHLDVTDVLVDAMRGRFTTWTRIRVNLRHVPEADRPPQETPDPDYDPFSK